MKATTTILLGLSCLGLALADGINDIMAPRKGNLRRQLKDDSANVVTVLSAGGLAMASLTTRNSWHEEGVNYVHLRVYFDNKDPKHRDICGITFSIEGFNASDPRTQYGNFEVLPNDKLMIPGSSSESNPLHYSRLAADTRPAWFIGLIMPFNSPTHDYPTISIDEVHLCEPLDGTATSPVSVSKSKPVATSP